MFDCYISDARSHFVFDCYISHARFLFIVSLLGLQSAVVLFSVVMPTLFVLSWCLALFFRFMYKFDCCFFVCFFYVSVDLLFCSAGIPFVSIYFVF